MSDINTIENQISAVRKYLKILERYKKYSQKEIEKDIDIRGAVERYLYLASQATIDLAERLISFRGGRKPSSFSESFYILNEENMINDDLTERLAKMAGFRNVMAHDYGEIDYSIVYNVLHKGLRDIEEFLEVVESQL